jgi:hypothetical protein
MATVELWMLFFFFGYFQTLYIVPMFSGPSCCCFHSQTQLLLVRSVADPDKDSYVFGPPGSRILIRICEMREMREMKVEEITFWPRANKGKIFSLKRKNQPKY